MKLQDWFLTPQGIRALKAEKRLVHRFLMSVRPNDVLQIGGPLNDNLIASAQILRSFFLNTEKQFESHKPYIQAEYDTLPVRSGVMDAVLCVHALERLKAIEPALLDIYRVLKPEGSVVVTGLQRFSIWRLFFRKRSFPSKTHFYSIDHVVHVLTTLGFVVEREQTVCFRLPSQKKRWLFLEMLGQLLLPFMGGVYMIVATKREAGVTPLFESLFSPQHSLRVQT